MTTRPAHETVTDHTNDTDDAPASPGDNRTVAATLAGRDLGRSETLALPDTALRRLLIGAFGIEAMTDMAGITDHGATPIQFVHVEGRSGNPVAVPMASAGGQPPQPAALLDYVSDAAQDAPDYLTYLVPPSLRGERATLVALGIRYEGWVYPPDHPEEDTRDPGDVPGSTSAKFVKVLTADQVLLTVVNADGTPPTARVQILDATEAGPCLAADRVCEALQRALPHFRRAYTAHTTMSSAQAAAGVSDRTLHRLDNLTWDEIDRVPDADLRDIARAVLAIIETHHDVCQWDASQGPYLFVHTRRDVDPDVQGEVTVIQAEDGSEDLPHLLLGIYRRITSDPLFRAEIQEGGEDYVAVSVLAEAWATHNDAPSDRLIADTPGAYETLTMYVVTRRGAMLHALQPRGGRSRISIALDIDDAAQRLQFPCVGPLHLLNKQFIDLDSRSMDPVEPTADLATLPPRAEAGDNNHVMLSTTWKLGDPRHGPIYPALPQDHPLAHALCGCSQPLGNGRPVQTIVLGPEKRDDVGRLVSGEWCNVHAALVHQSCMHSILAQLAPLVFGMHQRARHDA